jgi:hypothetical protein
MADDRNEAVREISAFYKEEFLKHKSRLEMQKEFHSDKDLNEIQMALDRIISEIDTICRIDQFSQLASQLLERIDLVTNLSGSPSRYSHRIH